MLKDRYYIIVRTDQECNRGNQRILISPGSSSIVYIIYSNMVINLSYSMCHAVRMKHLPTPLYQIQNSFRCQIKEFQQFAIYRLVALVEYKDNYWRLIVLAQKKLYGSMMHTAYRNVVDILIRFIYICLSSKMSIYYIS